MKRSAERFLKGKIGLGSGKDMIFESLTKYKDNPFNDKLISYSLSEIKAKYGELIPIGIDNYLVLKFSGDTESSLIEFALFEFLSATYDEPESTKMSCIFQGYGFGGANETLRECRHTYWYPDNQGYGFYMKGKIITEAIKLLGKYFDLD